MRNYIDYLNEITEEELRRGFIGYGLFPEKAPNFVSSIEFYEYIYQTVLPN